VSVERAKKEDITPADAVPEESEEPVEDEAEPSAGEIEGDGLNRRRSRRAT
jgi:hypothetical protein